MIVIIFELLLGLIPMIIKENYLSPNGKALIASFPQRTSWKEIFSLIGKGLIADSELH